jgi:hypothetical protein
MENFKEAMPPKELLCVCVWIHSPEMQILKADVGKFLASAKTQRIQYGVLK